MENSEKKLWRYMPLISLIDLLQSKEIRLPAANSFEDVREGHVGLEATIPFIPAEQAHRSRDALRRQNEDSFVSCWHLSSAESLAMWRLYGGSGSSVAIVSNVGKVMSAAHDFCQDLSYTGMFGEVIYDNYVTDNRVNVQTIGLPFGYQNLPVPNSLLLLFMKASAFKYEQEWRLVMHRKSTGHKAIRIPVPNLEELIEAIYVHPEAPEWIVESVKRLVSVQFKHSNIQVSRSPLSTHFGI